MPAALKAAKDRCERWRLGAWLMNRMFVLADETRQARLIASEALRGLVICNLIRNLRFSRPAKRTL